MALGLLRSELQVDSEELSSEQIIQDGLEVKKWRTERTEQLKKKREKAFYLFCTAPVAGGIRKCKVCLEKKCKDWLESAILACTK